METANDIRKIGLHNEVKMRCDNRYENKFATVSGDTVIFSSRKEAIQSKNEGFGSRINRRTEFFLSDGRLMIQEGEYWTSQGMHDPNPIGHFDWIAYFSEEQERISFWENYCIEHLALREKSVESFNAIYRKNNKPELRNLRNTWLYEGCGA